MEIDCLSYVECASAFAVAGSPRAHAQHCPCCRASLVEFAEPFLPIAFPPGNELRLMNPRIGRMPPTRPSGITDGGRLRQIPRHLHDFYLMWIFTTQGFYSVVQHVDRPEQVIVRCRTREDLEALGEQIPSLEPFEDAGADYRYRAIVDKSDWVAALSVLAEQLDYPNFKNEVASRQGHERSALYGKVWSVLRPLQPRNGTQGPR